MDQFPLARWRDDGVMEMPLRVAGYDVDFAGIVNNAVYVRWLEDLRTAFIARRLPMDVTNARGVVPVLVRLELDYRAPLSFGDRVAGRLWTRESSRARAVIETEIYRTPDGRVCAHALQTVCYVDSKTGRPVRMPPELTPVSRTEAR